MKWEITTEHIRNIRIKNMLPSNDHKTILFGLGWSSLSTFVNGLTQILRLSILTRFLEKSDFGIVAILTFIVGLTQVFSDMGFSAAIMSQKDLKRQEFLNLYWTQFILFFITFFIVSCFAYSIASFYNAPSLSILTPLIMLELPLLGIGKLYDTVLQKKLLFKTIAIRNIVAATSSLLLAIILAYLGCGVYSMVISIVFNAVVINIWNFAKGQSEYHIQFIPINFRNTSSLIRVGIYQMGTQILDYLSSKLDILIISIYLGTSELGIYNLAKELILKFVMVINSIASKVMLPMLAKYQDDLPQMKHLFLRFLEKLSLVNAPIIAFMVLFNDIIIRFFYGENYMEVGPIIQIMAIWSMFVVISMPNSFVAIATKRTDITFYYTIIRIIIMSVFLFSFARTSLMSAAWTMIGAYSIMFFVNWKILLERILCLNLTEYVTAFYRSWVGFALIVTLIIHFTFAFKLFTFALLTIGYFYLFERKVITTLLVTILNRNK
ncbi:MAG: oligosaccharide flippase family protein [Bacteroidaceae bacterium]|nr:oligosaccharide flippase family protein [Bacteroidaceae bacterium]